MSVSVWSWWWQWRVQRGPKGSCCLWPSPTTQKGVSPGRPSMSNISEADCAVTVESNRDDDDRSAQSKIGQAGPRDRVSSGFGHSVSRPYDFLLYFMHCSSTRNVVKEVILGKVVLEFTHLHGSTHPKKSSKLCSFFFISTPVLGGIMIWEGPFRAQNALVKKTSRIRTWMMGDTEPREVFNTAVKTDAWIAGWFAPAARATRLTPPLTFNEQYSFTAHQLVSSSPGTGDSRFVWIMGWICPWWWVRDQTDGWVHLLMHFAKEKQKLGTEEGGLEAVAMQCLWYAKILFYGFPLKLIWCSVAQKRAICKAASEIRIHPRNSGFPHVLP